MRSEKKSVTIRAIIDTNVIADSDIRELLILIEERTEHVLLSRDVDICRDKDDNLIIETAIRGNAISCHKGR